VLLLCLLAPGLYSLTFYGSRLAHRMRMWYGEHSRPLQTLILDSATIRWTKKNRELIVNNAYFDVTHIQYRDGVATITGIYDHEETEMHETYAAEQHKQQGKKHTTRQIAQWLLTGWLPASPPSLKPPAFLQFKCYNGLYLFFLPNITLPINLPPPRLQA
jgi:hypothetical protein